ncbi:sigma-70 family RNA polymerase sigma factor [Chitinophaga sp.]|uniref:RNA polymerase sigma factor n=1 Tax=Chitinophaga sp. TaxID=1869181 RepID=UPI0031D39AB6
MLLRVAEGDKKAFASLFDHYKGRLYNTVWRLTNDIQLAEEVVQDVFLKVWLHKERLRQISHFPAYLYTIARRDAYRALKKLARERSLVMHDELPESAMAHMGTDELVSHKEYAILLNRAIDRLPRRQRETFILIRQEGLRREQAAQQLQVSPETVKYNLDEAMRKIRAYFHAHSDLGFIFILFLDNFREYF